MYLKILIRENLFYVKKENWIKTRRQILQSHVHQNQNLGKRGPSRGIIQKCEPQERGPCAPKFKETMTNMYKETCTVVRDEKTDRLLPHQIRRPRLTEGKNRQKQTKRKALQTKGEIFHADFKNSKNPSCKFGHPPVSQNYKTEAGCIHVRKCFFRHVEAYKKTSKKSKKHFSVAPAEILDSNMVL